MKLPYKIRQEQPVGDGINNDRFGLCHTDASCDYGASRSPAIALIILADRLGPGQEQKALQQVLDVRPDAIPNNLVVELGDNLLHRNGALRRSLDDLYEEVLGGINFLL